MPMPDHVVAVVVVVVVSTRLANACLFLLPFVVLFSDLRRPRRHAVLAFANMTC